ncbi:MAG: RHS repeat-associated core domain-containing protein, partial [Acidimicrobiales bacterium]
FGAGASWTTDTSGVTNSATSATPVALPSLTPSGTGELYFGLADVDNGGVAGTSSGFTYEFTPANNIVAFNPDVSSTVSPTASQAWDGNYHSLAVLLKANVPTTSTTDYAWNSYGELCNVSAATTACGSAPSSGTAYTYNGDGLRMTATESSSGAMTSTTNSTWDNVGGGSIPLNINDATTTSSGTTNTSYIYGDLLFGGTAPIEQITTTSTGSSEVYLTASQTGVQGVYSSSGAVLEQALYSTYGLQTITSGTDVTPFGFQGSYVDSTGLIYLINRYYDPTTDQFLSIDPDVMATDQPYVFTNDDPLNGTDPTGLLCLWGCIAHGIATGFDHTRHFVAAHKTVIIQTGLVIVVGVATDGAGDAFLLTEDSAEEGATSAMDILKPGGSLIGKQGESEGVRTLGSDEMDSTFSKLSNLGEQTSSKYPGKGYDLPNGDFVGMRMSEQFGRTLDVNIKSVEEVTKFHLER